MFCIVGMARFGFYENKVQVKHTAYIMNYNDYIIKTKVASLPLCPYVCLPTCLKIRMDFDAVFLVIQKEVFMYNSCIQDRSK